MLSLLLPTKPVARLVSDPRGFMHEHRAELGVLRDFVRGLEAAPPAAVPAPQPRQPPPAGGARRRAPARIARGESLLR